MRVSPRELAELDTRSAQAELAVARAPLGIAVIGGVITSTILTLLVIPTVYEIHADTRDWVAAKFGRRSDPGSSTEPVRVGQ